MCVGQVLLVLANLNRRVCYLTISAGDPGRHEPISLRRLADTLIEVHDGKGSYKIREFPADRKVIDIGDYYGDDRLFRSLTGWAPKVTLADGLAESLDYYRAHFDHYV